jgi:hypothetical protein
MNWTPLGSRTVILSRAGGSNSELRLMSHAWLPTLESSEWMERSEREARGFTRDGYRSAH